MSRFSLTNINSPCLNCENRTTPKLCEVTCEKWQNYMKEKKECEKLLREKKQFERRMGEALWGGKYKKRRSKWN